jgi:hypothetical protein
MQIEAQSSESLDNRRRPQFPFRARSYFAEQFNLALDEDDSRFERLSDLYVVRNGLAAARAGEITVLPNTEPAPPSAARRRRSREGP